MLYEVITPDKLLWLPFVMIGLGLAPIFPTMIHETPNRFGKQKSQTIIGYQMAFAYIGNALFPPLFGLIIEKFTILLLPLLLLICGVILLFSSERINHIIKKENI